MLDLDFSGWLKTLERKTRDGRKVALENAGLKVHYQGNARMSTTESQTAHINLQQAYVCLSVSSSLRVFFCRWNTDFKVSSLSSSQFILSFLSFMGQLFS